jgi:hypothetical protein
MIENDQGRKSDLDAVIAGIPWEDGWELGKGIDAVTGALSVASALKRSPIEAAPVTRASYSGRLIRNESQFSQEVDVSLNSKFNIGSVDISASTNYLQKVTFSELSLTIVVRYKTEPEGYDEFETVELTDEAAALLRDPPEFRKRYGDYFISGARRVSEFVAIYNLHATDSKKVREFSQSIGVVSSILSVEGTLRFKEAASRNDMTINCSVDFVGITEKPSIIPTTPDEILKTLEWFKDHSNGVNEQATLTHYSKFDPKYPISVDVPSDVFVALHSLYRSLWLIRSYHVALPEVYKKRYAEEVDTLQKDISTRKQELPVDADQRSKLADRASDLQKDLDEVIERRDFYTLVKQATTTEPKKDKKVSSEKSQYTWTFGYVTYPGSIAVTISSTKREYRQSSRMGWREDTLELSQLENVRIVGWEVRSNWRDNSNGQWKKVSNTIIGSREAQVHVKSAHLRGCDWTVVFYTVPAADYLFD